MDTTRRVVAVLRGRKRRDAAKERKDSMWTLTGPRSEAKKSGKKPKKTLW